MENYSDYLPELKSTTLFCDMTDDEIVSLLKAMKPRIIRKKAGEMPFEPPKEGETPNMDFFRVVLKTTPANPPQPRYFKYDMPKFGEPGMMMAEIPSLSCMFDYIKPAMKMPHKPMPLKYDLEMLELSGEMITKFYSAEVAPAQGKMLRNFLGILAQKVCDVRQELFLLRDNVDMYANKIER